MRAVVFLVTVLSVLWPLQAEARKVVATLSGDQGNCIMQENAQLSLTFNGQESDLKKIKPMMDEKIQQALALAEKAGVEKMEVQSSNYSVYNYNSGGCGTGGTGTYQYNSSVSFNVAPADKASDLMVLMSDNGFVPSINVNSYRQCQ